MRARKQRYILRLPSKLLSSDFGLTHGGSHFLSWLEAEAIKKLVPRNLRSSELISLEKIGPEAVGYFAVDVARILEEWLAASTGEVELPRPRCFHRRTVFTGTPTLYSMVRLLRSLERPAQQERDDSCTGRTLRRVEGLAIRPLIGLCLEKSS